MLEKYGKKVVRKKQKQKKDTQIKKKGFYRSRKGK